MNRHFSLLLIFFLVSLTLVVVGYEKLNSPTPPVQEINDPGHVSSDQLQSYVEQFSNGEASEVSKLLNCSTDCKEIGDKIYQKLTILEELASRSPCSIKHLYLKAAKKVFQQEVVTGDISVRQKDATFPNRINKLEFNLKKLSKVDC